MVTEILTVKQRTVQTIVGLPAAQEKTKSVQVGTGAHMRNGIRQMLDHCYPKTCVGILTQKIKMVPGAIIQFLIKKLIIRKTGIIVLSGDAQCVIEVISLWIEN